jgi:HlyD family secretion protein
MTRRRTILLVLAAILLVGGGLTAFKLRAWTGGVLSAEEPLVPTVRVTRGALDLSVNANGELRASRSMMLQAPTVSGGTLRLLTIAQTGTAVHTGDVIMEFDPTEQQYALEQARSELLEAEEEITKLRADQDVQTAQDQVDLLTARFDVRRAELDAKPDRDLVGANDYQRRQLSLDEAQHRLAQVAEGGKSRAETSRAALAAAEEKGTKAKMAADRAQQNIDGLVVKAPMDGFLIARENRDAGGGFFFGGMTLPEYRAGDSVFPGRPVADIFDISAMEIRAKVNEQQRNNVAVGQAAHVDSEALSSVPLTAKVTAVSGQAQTDFWWSSGPLRDFDVTLRLDQADARLRPGTSVRLMLAGTRLESVLHIPRSAIFEKNGKSIVYARVGNHFETRIVKPTHRTEGRVAIEGSDGISEGLEIALVNPDSVASATTKPAASAATRAPK